MGLQRRAWVKNTFNEAETYWLLGKEKIPGTTVSKEDHAESFLEPERNHHYWFSSKT